MRNECNKRKELPKINVYCCNDHGKLLSDDHGKPWQRLLTLSFDTGCKLSCKSRAEFIAL